MEIQILEDIIIDKWCEDLRRKPLPGAHDDNFI